jgi:phenylpyruvate tautomerase PptA (4-oxalocrotonate tautomerase family)
MPTYVCHARRGTLSTDDKQALAERVTAAHKAATGAPTSFVQVLFTDFDRGDRFIAGRVAPVAGVFVHGHIRDGRTAAMKQALAEGLRDAVVAVTDLPGHLVWVYLSELAPQQMIEFGRVLPPAGAEQQWIDDIPSRVRARLPELDGA